MKGHLLAIVIVLLPVFTGAAEVRIVDNTPATLTAEVTSDYVLGDGDSRVDGRNLALEAAKRAAAEAAGSYVEAEVTVAGDQVEKERITTVSAAFLKTRLLDESVSLTADGRTRLTLRVRAELDKQDLRRRVAELREQPQKEKQIEQLRQQNSELQSELKKLTAQLQAERAKAPAAGPVPKPRPELAERRDVVLSRLEQNAAAIRRVFEKGTLAGLARQSEGDYQRAREDLDTNYFGYLQNNMTVRLGEPRFRKIAADRYEVAVPVEWSIDPKPLLATLNKYFWEYSRKPIGAGNPLWVRKYQNDGDDRKEPFSMDLFQTLMARTVAIEVSAGRFRKTLSLSGPGSNFDRGNYQLRWQGRPGEKIVYSEANPVLLEVPAAELDRITAIEARVVVK